jgi:HME family heavy-metal exporter
MLASLIRFSIARSGLVVTAAVLLVLFAVQRLPHMGVDVFPELDAPTVVVMAEADGLAADEVEQFVTFPIESAVNGLTGLRRIRSASAIGLSIVWVDLEWGADLLRARQLVAERLDAARATLPEGVAPFITPVGSIAGEIMLIGLSSPDGSASPLDLRSYAEFELRPQLLAVSGIAQVGTIGGELPEYQIVVSQERLRSFGLTFADVARAAGESHSRLSAGYLPNVDHLEIPLRQHSRVRSIADIEQTVVRADEHGTLRIVDVADVRIAGAPRRGTATVGGHAAVVLSIQKAPRTNTLALTDQLDAVLDQVEASLPAGMALERDVVRQSHFIQRSIDNVVAVLRDAVLIVSVVLVLFLMNWRTTLITLTALPISLAAALLVMDWSGLGLNVMTLGGLAVAIGVLVDDAIIDVENVHRRLGERGLDGGTGAPRSLAETIFAASNEIRPAMVIATVIIVMVFVPLLFLEGLEGRFFSPLGLTYMVSIGVSLVVALTVTPALCRLLLAPRDADARGHASGDGRFVRFLKRLYAPALAAALRLRGFVIGASFLASAAALWLATTFGSSFLPSFNEGTFTVFLLAPPGTSLEESDRLASAVERRLVALDGVRSVARRTGRAERDEHAEPVSNSEIEVTVRPEADKLAVRARIDEVLASIPGMTTMVGQPIEHRLSHVLSGTPAALAISVFGDDLDALRAIAKRIEAEVRSIPGARDVNANREVLITSLPVRYRRADLAALGLTPAAVAEQVRDALHGDTVGLVNQGARLVEIVVRLAEDERDSIDDVENLIVHGPTGALARLADVADIGPERSSNLITREGARRKAVVSLDVADGHNLGDLVADVRARVDPIVAAAGFTAHYGGQFEARESAARAIGVSGLATLVVMFLLLQAATGTTRSALLVMANMPLALIGGVVAVFATEGAGLVGNVLALFRGGYVAPVLSIATLVGFITLFGIAVRNGILLVNHYRHLEQVEGAEPLDAVQRGSSERLVPILMTALSSALGLVPLALALGEPGAELLAPLAVVVLGGLVTSTVLNLFVVPAGYTLAFRARTPSRRA